MTMCAGPDCTNELEPHAGPGRPREYCSLDCIRAAETVRKAARDPVERLLAETALLGQDLARAEAHVSPIDVSAKARAKASGAFAGRVPDARPDVVGALVRWLRDGELYAWDRTASKAALVEDATGQVLVPQDLTVEITNVLNARGLRSLASVRPTVRNKYQARLLTAAATGWGKLEAGTAATDANVGAESPGQEIEVHDLVSLALIGQDELADSPDNVWAAVVEAISSAILDSETTAFVAGTGSGQPKGLTLAANVTRVPAAQKVAVGTSNTPTAAQLATIPFLLPDRYRDNGTWLLHPTSAGKIQPLISTFEPGPNGRGLLGWPVRILSGLPDPATAGTADASILFADVRSAYRVADRRRITVQRLVERYAEAGLVGMLVRHRVGGDLIRPGAVAIYTQ